MAICIRNPKTEALARKVARETGESMTQAITTALEQRLERVRGSRTRPDLVAEIMEISARCASLPVLDTRGEDDILGYSDDGAPTPW